MVLITGATGFVGGALVRRLTEDDKPDKVVVAVRRVPPMWSKNVKIVQVDDLGPNSNWSEALERVDVVVHCAARVHVMEEDASDPLEAYRLVNVEGTLNLARQAAQAGARRFVFVSSIKVNGEQTIPGHPFRADSTPAPVDPYGISKYEAERELLQFGAMAGLEVVIVRPPLVYGPGVKANFASLIKWISLGIPFPLGRVDNSRSLVALDNLIDLLVVCMTHPMAAGEVFLVSDGEDVSTNELIRRTARAMGRRAVMIPLPLSWLKIIGVLLKSESAIQRLCGSLQVDIEKTKHVLQWTPLLTLDHGLQKIFNK